MAKVEKQARKTENAEIKAAHVANLIATLGDPTEWQPTGVVLDNYSGLGISQSSCACGHDIRWAFQIRHATKGINYLGSTCINHYAQIDPELHQRLQAVVKKHKKELKRLEAEAGKAEAAAEIAALQTEYEFKRSVLFELREMWGAGTNPEFSDDLRQLKARSPRYSQAHYYAKWYTQALADINRVWARVNDGTFKREIPPYCAKLANGKIAEGTFIDSIDLAVTSHYHWQAVDDIRGYGRYGASWSASTRVIKFFKAGYIAEVLNAPEWLREKLEG